MTTGSELEPQPPFLPPVLLPTSTHSHEATELKSFKVLELIGPRLTVRRLNQNIFSEVYLAMKCPCFF